MKRFLLFSVLFSGIFCTNNTLLAQTDRGNNVTYNRVCGDFYLVGGGKFFWMYLTSVHVDKKHKTFSGEGFVEGLTPNYEVKMDGQYKDDFQLLRFHLKKTEPDPCDPIKLNGLDSFYCYGIDNEFTIFFSTDESEIKFEGVVNFVGWCKSTEVGGGQLAFSLSTHCHQKPSLTNKKDTVIVKQEIITKVTPNPVVNSSTISYTLTKISKVNITVYNAMMQPVKVLVNETKNAGNYSVIWNANASQIKPGIYRVVATVDGISTSKMVQVIK